MVVTFREINYKTIDVPDGTSIEQLDEMITLGNVIVGDTNDTEYAVKLEENEEFISLD